MASDDPRLRHAHGVLAHREHDAPVLVIVRCTRCREVIGHVDREARGARWYPRQYRDRTDNDSRLSEKQARAGTSANATPSPRSADVDVADFLEGWCPRHGVLDVDAEYVREAARRSLRDGKRRDLSA
jgi:hypothetical protein